MGVKVTLSSKDLPYGKYQDRYMTFSVEQTSETELTWTLKVLNGPHDFYKTGPTTATIGSTDVYTKSRVTATGSSNFPNCIGTKTGTYDLSTSDKSIDCSLLTWIWYDTGNPQDKITATLNLPCLTIQYKPNGGTHSSNTVTVSGTKYYVGTNSSGYIYQSTSSSSTATKQQKIYYNGTSDWNPVNDTSFNLVREGYVFAGWKNSATNKILDQNTNYSLTTLHPSIASGNQTITLEAQWVLDSSLKVHYDFNGSPSHAGTPLGLQIISPRYKLMSYNRIGTLTETNANGSTIDSLPKDNTAKKHTVLAPSHFGVFCAGYTFVEYTTNLNTSAKIGAQLSANQLNTNTSKDTWIHAGANAWRENILTQNTPYRMYVNVPGEQAFAKFIPTVSRTYIFSSSGTDTAFNLGGLLCDSDFEIMAPATSTTSGKEFSLIYTLTAGQTYYFAIQDKALGESIGSTTITITSTTYTLNLVKGTGISSVSGGGEKAYNTQCTIKATPLSGYHFKGWSIPNQASLVTSNPYTFLKAAQDETITALAASNTYKVVYKSGTETSNDNRTFQYDTTYTLNSCPFTKAGYTFIGWDTNSNATTKVYGPEASVKNLTATNNATVYLYAVWQRSAGYTVSFNANGGTVSPSSKTVYYLDTYGSLPTPTRTNYIFVGWFTSASGGTQIFSNTEVTTNKNHTLYAHWSKNSFTITFNFNGGTRGSYPTSVSSNGNTVTIPTMRLDAPSYFPKKFNGWGEGTNATAIASFLKPERIWENIQNNISATAIWKDPLTYIPTSQSFRFRFDINYYKITPSRKTEYKITTDDTTDKVNPQLKIVDQNKTEILYKTKTIISSTKTEYIYELPKVTGSNCYYVKLWNTITPYTKAKGFDASESIALTTVINPFYTVTLNTQGGVLPPLSSSTKEVKQTDPYGILPEPTYTGYQFLGWYTAKVGGTKITSTTIVNLSDDITLYAQWDPIGLVKIYTESGWQYAIPYIYTSSGWKRAIEYTYSGGWKQGINYGQHKLIE